MVLPSLFLNPANLLNPISIQAQLELNLSLVKNPWVGLRLGVRVATRVRLSQSGIFCFGSLSLGKPSTRPTDSSCTCNPLTSMSRPDFQSTFFFLKHMRKTYKYVILTHLSFLVVTGFIQSLTLLDKDSNKTFFCPVLQLLLRRFVPQIQDKSVQVSNHNLVLLLSFQRNKSKISYGNLSM